MIKKTKKSFRQYYNTYFEKIYRYIYFRTGKDRALAEDLTSEIMLKAYESFEGYDEQRKFSTWIYRIAHNHLVDYYKKAKLSQVPLDEAFAKSSNDTVLSEKLDVKMAVGKVSDVVMTLPTRQKEIVILKYYNDLTNKEIAEVLKVSEAYIRVNLHRAITQLKTWMKVN